MKVSIHGNDNADRLLDGEVCSHLSQILEFIVANGFCSELGERRFTNDRSDGYIYRVRGELPIDEIKERFELPDVLHLSSSYGIFCKKCWCSIKAAA